MAKLSFIAPGGIQPGRRAVVAEQLGATRCLLAAAGAQQALSWPDAINRPSAIRGGSRTHAHPRGASTHTGRDPYARSTGPRHATLRNTDGLAVHHRICGSGGDRHQADDGSYDGASRHGVLLTTSGLGSPSSDAPQHGGHPPPTPGRGAALLWHPLVDQAGRGAEGMVRAIRPPTSSPRQVRWEPAPEPTGSLL